MSRILSRDQVHRIESFRIARRMDIVQLKQAINAPFRWPTLLRALSGKPVSEATYRFLHLWLERFFPVQVVPDGKAAAANDSVPCSQ